MNRLTFVLIREGSSDSYLVAHLRRLCNSLGDSDAVGYSLDFGQFRNQVGSSVEKKLIAALVAGDRADIIFIHRDADSKDAEPRHSEIADAAYRCRCKAECVAIVPVQEIEAWLLLDEMAIRKVAGNAEGKLPLHLPKLTRVESTARPKERLESALVLASELKGRRLDALKSNVSDRRRVLLTDLPITGPIEKLPAWKRMRDDIKAAIDRLNVRTHEGIERDNS